MHHMSSDDERKKAILKQIDEYRREIDKHDEDIVEALGERMKVVKKIAPLKKEAGIDAEVREREQEVKRNWQRIASRKSLSGTFVEKILELILQESKK